MHRNYFSFNLFSSSQADFWPGTDVVELLPASMKVADMVADNPGSWLLHCHVAEHMGAGMMLAFDVD